MAIEHTNLQRYIITDVWRNYSEFDNLPYFVKCVLYHKILWTEGESDNSKLLMHIFR